VKETDIISLIDDAFFKEEIDRGMIFQVRRSNFLKGKRTLNIIDEIEEKEKLQKAFEEAEAKRDMTYEEYLAKYINMIEGRVTKEDGTRSNHASRPVTGHEEAKSAAGSNRAKNNSSAMSKKSGSGNNTMNNSREGFDIKEDLKQDLPDSCYQIIMKGNKISKLDKSFKLLTHPYPLIEGEMIVFQPFKADQYDKSLIVFRDYSLRKRIPTKPVNKKLTSYH
jgi:hypothetical protein